LGLQLGGQPITFIRVDDLKKQAYWGSVPFSWSVFWAPLPDRMGVRLWGYFNQVKLRNG
jgi:hypothetical protein